LKEEYEEEEKKVGGTVVSMKKNKDM